MAEQGRTCDIFRLTTVYSSMAGHGGIWLVLCVYRDADFMAAVGSGIQSVQERHSRKEARDTNATKVYLCTIYEHSTQPPSPELRNARVRVSRVRACVILLYYYIIIIL